MHNLTTCTCRSWWSIHDLLQWITKDLASDNNISALCPFPNPTVIKQIKAACANLSNKKNKWDHMVPFFLRPKICLAPPKHDVISIPRQHYTNTKHIPIESCHPVVSIMPRYMDKKLFCENLCCREVKIDKILGVTYRTFLSNATTFRNECDNKRDVRMKHIT